MGWERSRRQGREPQLYGRGECLNWESLSPGAQEPDCRLREPGGRQASEGALSPLAALRCPCERGSACNGAETASRRPASRCVRPFTLALSPHSLLAKLPQTKLFPSAPAGTSQNSHPAHKRVAHLGRPPSTWETRGLSACHLAAIEVRRMCPYDQGASSSFPRHAWTSAET